MNTPAMHVHNLTIGFGSLIAVNDLSLTVEQGSIHGFLGPNGAGKSTTIRALIGVLRPRSGSVSVLGQDPVKYPEVLRGVGYVAGDATLWEHLTGAEVIRALETLRKTHSNRALENELIEAFQLDPSKKIREYSTGNRRKVSLITALSHEPKLLILDEPTAGLDPIMEQVFLDQVRRARHNGTSVLLSSHILSEVEQLCDYVTVLKDGRAVASNEVSYLRKISAHRITATLREIPKALIDNKDVVFNAGHLSMTCDASAVSRILRIIIDSGGQDITSTSASLEEIFLRHYSDNEGEEA
ncbi:ABC transporter ATP-binding protein [Corynebacterium crudilactis]|uniref:Multidrug ABC transporter ATP-binding protein n=1 Tax=Corynebacterium crudilactis TaxID=1652495 RepID=A0A172QWR3_9CORY|nr:ABC transporter ATP-binding protein [Corynebacterium crudilactis]ANE05154.1 multidrug ABC transporter ATP-binding protein [Corynebacterium crudilactis]